MSQMSQNLDKTGGHSENAVRILLVDDEAGHRRLIADLIKDEAPDLVLEMADSAQACMDRLEAVSSGKEPIELILMDHRISPGMDGLELLWNLRRLGYPMPVIFLTGQGSEEVAAAAFREGAADYFTKSMGLTQVPRLVHSIRRAVDAYRMEKSQDQLVQDRDEIRSVYRDIVERSADGIMLIADGRILMLNKAAAHILAYDDPEQLVGMSPLVHIAPVDRIQVAEYTARMLKGEPMPSLLEYRGIRRDGTIFTAQMTSALVTYEGRPALQGIIRDVTGSRRVEHKIAESEARYRALFESSGNAFAVLTPIKLRFIDVNSQFSRMASYSREELLSMSLKELLNPQDYKWAMEQARRRIQCEPDSPLRFRSELIARDGRRSPISASARYVPELGLIFCVITEVSDMIELEQQLRQRGTCLDTLGDALEMVVLTVDSQLTIESANTSMLSKLFGYRIDEIIGKPLSLLLAEEEDECRFLDELPAMLELKKNHLAKLDFIKKDGTRFACGILVRALDTDNDQSRGALVLIGEAAGRAFRGRSPRSPGRKS